MPILRYPRHKRIKPLRRYDTAVTEFGYIGSADGVAINAGPCPVKPNRHLAFAIKDRGCFIENGYAHAERAAHFGVIDLKRLNFGDLTVTDP